MHTDAIAQEITQSARNYFGDRLASVLLYGSSLSAREIPNDLDVIIVLKERETTEDLTFLRRERAKYTLEIDLQTINLPDITPNSFAHDTHGQFVISFLKNARPLYGENPFLHIFPPYSAVVTSVIQKAQYYYFRAKKIQANTLQPANAQDFSFHRKKLLLMIADFWLAYSGEVEDLREPERLKNILSLLTHREPSPKELDFLLGVDTTFGWAEIFSCYQTYYFALLDALRPNVIMTSSYLGNIYVESHSIRARRLVVIASGCPTDYGHEEIALFLTIRGYDVAVGHYTATGRSTGTEFRAPHNDISDIVEYFKDAYDEIVVLGNSFGGYASLTLREPARKIVHRIIAVSPVLDFLAVHGIETLANHLTSKHPGWYRFKEHEFDSFVHTSTAVQDTACPTTILHGAHDMQIPISDIENFCKKTHSNLRSLDAGHLSLARLTREHLRSLHDLL